MTKMSSRKVLSSSVGVGPSGSGSTGGGPTVGGGGKKKQQQPSCKKNLAATTTSTSQIVPQSPLSPSNSNATTTNNNNNNNSKIKPPPPPSKLVPKQHPSSTPPIVPSPSPCPPDLDDDGLDDDEDDDLEDILTADVISDDENPLVCVDDDLDIEDICIPDDLLTADMLHAASVKTNNNNSSSPYNSPIFLNNSSSEDDDDDLGEVDESIERDESDEDEEDDDEDEDEASGFLLPADDTTNIQGIPPDAQARLEAFFEAAGFTDGKLMSDPENLRKLTLTVSSALGEASAAINRMRDSQRKSLEEGRNDSMEEGDSLLALACSSGYFELARVLLAMGANVDDRGSKGDLTPLMDASSQGHVEIVKLLVSHGAEINASSACGNSSLMYACAAGHEDVVRELLKAGAKVEENNENGHTPLMEASSAGHVGVAKILLDHGAGINTHSNEFKESALTVACYKGHLDMVKYLLEAGADQQHKTDEMHTALMEASMDGHVDVARLLLDSGAQVNMPADSFESPLTLAACGGHVELAELLVERGANIEEVNDEGYTPLMESSREGHLGVVKTLLKAGAKINAQTEETHETALTLAACGGFLDVVDTLINSGADIDTQNTNGASTALMEAAQEGHYQVVKYLLDHNAEISHQTQSGDTALSYACENGHVDVADLLISRGSDSEHVSEGGRTPLMKACRGGHIDVIRLLIQKGVDVNAETTNNDHTPLSLCCSGGHLQCAEVLLERGANPYHKLKDNSTMIIEAARGGHTNVIRCLLEKHEKRGALKSNATSGDKSSHQSQQAQAKSVLRKSRSTSTLDSTSNLGQQQQQPLKKQIINDVTVKVQQQQPVKKAMNLPPSETKQRKTPQQQQPQQPQQSPQNNNFCVDCLKTTPEQHQGHIIKRSATEIASSAPSAQLSPCGPPLVPSQVTASTAISERPKAKANKPSARKQLLLQQQQQQLQLQQQQQQQQASSTTTTNIPIPPQQQQQIPIIPGSTSPQMQIQQVRSANTITTGGSTTITTQTQGQFKIDPKQLTKIFHQHQQQIITLNKDKQQSDLLEEFEALKSQIVPEGIDFDQLMASEQFNPNDPSFGFLPMMMGSSGNMNTTLVVGQGETETIIDGGSLVRGANEMIINATTTTSKIGKQTISSTGIQVQSYQASDEKRGKKSLHALEASGSNSEFPHHPPPLPQAIQEAAASAGVLPQGAYKSIKRVVSSTIETVGDAKIQQQAQPKPTVAQGSAASSKSIATQASHQSSIMATTTTQLVPPPQKKALAKRSRPFSQQGNSGMKQNQSVASTQTTLTGQQASGLYKGLDVNTATETNGETSLSIASALGHYEVIEFLLTRKANIEHRDKKGCTPLILASDGGHEKVVELLLNHKADIEAQSDRTKDTALSLACTKGRYEVVELLLKRGANKEHRNVSDYTPLSLAASGGYVNIIKLLLQNGAEINSRTGSKLGISPLMLAAMNGNVAAVKLLLDMGSDINASIETNKNTALTLACFQGRHEVVALLVDRRANIEHRAKTGLTPLMEAANGGFTEVGKALLDKGAEINSAPVPATRDTALTITADKGHYRFVELLLQRGAIVDARNKKGCTPLWLACHSGHLDVCQILYRHGADLDIQDNRRISCLMASFRKGHVKVIRWIVKHVTQFPSDSEMNRYLLSISNESELLKKCHQCSEYIKQAKDKQALEANKNASSLLEELDLEKSREESKRLAAARKREKRKKKKMEKKQVEDDDEQDDENENQDEQEDDENGIGEIIDSGIDANSQGSISSNGKENKSSRNARARGRRGSAKQQKEELPLPPTTLAAQQSNVNNLNTDKKKDTIILEEQSSLTATKNKKKKNKNKKNNQQEKEVDNNIPSIQPTSNQPTNNEKQNNSNMSSAAMINNNDTSSNQIKNSDDIKEFNHVYNSKGVKEKEKSTTNYASKKEKDDLIFHSSSSSIVASKSASATTANSNKQVLNKAKSSASATCLSTTVTSGSNNNGSEYNNGPLEPLMGISLQPPQVRNHSLPQQQNMDTTSSVSQASSKSMTSIEKVSGFISGPSVSATAIMNNHNTNTNSLSTPVKSYSSSNVHSNTGNIRKDEGWKEVTRSCTSSRTKKVIVSSSVISRVIGRGGCNINAIREATGAHIEVEKQQKGQVQLERTIQIKGTGDSTKQAHTLITALMNEPDLDVKKLLPTVKLSSSSISVTSSMSNFSIGDCTSETSISVGSNKSFTSMSNVTSSSSNSSTNSQLGASSSNSTFSGILSTSNQNTNNGSTIKPLIGKGSNLVGLKSPTTTASSSPPIFTSQHQTKIQSSPPIKKPIAISPNETLFKMKKSIVIVPTASTVTTSSSPSLSSNTGSLSYLSKLTQYQQHQQQQQQALGGSVRNMTPGPSVKSVTPTPVNNGILHTSFGANIEVHNTVPIAAISPISQNKKQTNEFTATAVTAPSKGIIGDKSHQNFSTIDSFNSQQKADINNEDINLVNENQIMLQQKQQQQMNNCFVQQPIGRHNKINNPPSALSPNSNPERSDSQQQHGNQQRGLEYSPFNTPLAFSKSTNSGWYPIVDINVSSSGIQQDLATSNLNNINSSSAVRAMNFASVAASRLTSTSSNTNLNNSVHHHASSAGNNIQILSNNNSSGANVAGSSSSTPPEIINNNKGYVDTIGIDIGSKIDASKAPGYHRGTSSLTAPLLRMQQQQQQHHNIVPSIPNTHIYGGGLESLTHFGMGLQTPASQNQNINVNIRQQQQQQANNSYITNYGQQYGHAEIIINNPQGNNNSLVYPNNSSGNANPTMLISSRLNPRAPIYNPVTKPPPPPPPAAQQQQQQQQQQQHHPNADQRHAQIHGMTAFQQMEQNNFYSKVNQFGSNAISGSTRMVGGVAMGNSGGGRQRVGSGWTNYPAAGGSQGDPGHLDSFQGITTSSDSMEGTSEHQSTNPLKMDENRRLPRPIGGERAYKQSSVSVNSTPVPVAGGMYGGSTMELVDHSNNLVPQQQQQQQQLGMQFQPSIQQPSNPTIHGQPWINIYAQPQQPQFMPNLLGSQQQPRSLFGRRFIEELDSQRSMEMNQQQQRANNGGPPQMMNMPNNQLPIFATNYGMDQQHIPKMESHISWDTTHPMMEEKHSMNWNAKWGN